MSPSATTILQAIVFFAVALALCHAYIFLAKPDAKFLKKIDYWWLGFSALSLISAAAAQRQLIARGELTYASERDQSQAKEVAFFAQEERKYVCETPWQPPADRQGDPMARYNSRAIACDYFTGIAQQFDKHGTDGAAIVRQFSMPPEPPDVAAHWRSETLSSAVTRAKAIIAADDRDRADTDSSDIEKLLTFATPYLLGAALAMRISKVTGELRL